MSSPPRRYSDPLVEALAASQRAVEADLAGQPHQATAEYARALALLQHALIGKARKTGAVSLFPHPLTA